MVRALVLSFLLMSAALAAPLPPPPASLRLDGFYQKYVDASGVPVVSSSLVADEALETAAFIARSMLEARRDVAQMLVRNHVRLAVMAQTEVTTDIPEHSELNRAFPATNWNVRCRGMGATMARPVCSCAEENLLHLKQDPYWNENILVHEFGHTMFQMGAVYIDPSLRERPNQCYQDAVARGLWANTYAATNSDEYWAEGTQDWFDCNAHASPSNGIHNQIHTQEQLRRYDPRLAALLDEVYPAYLKYDGKILAPR